MKATGRAGRRDAPMRSRGGRRKKWGRRKKCRLNLPQNEIGSATIVKGPRRGHDPRNPAGSSRGERLCDWRAFHALYIRRAKIVRSQLPQNEIGSATIVKGVREYGVRRNHRGHHDLHQDFQRRQVALPSQGADALRRPGTRDRPPRSARTQPQGTTAFAGSWDQGGESRRPAGRVPRIDHGVDRFFALAGPRARMASGPLSSGEGSPAGDPETSNQAAHGPRVRPRLVGAVATRSADARRRHRRRARGCGRVLLAGASGGGSLASRVGLSLGLYDSPSMTKS